MLARKMPPTFNLLYIFFIPKYKSSLVNKCGNALSNEMIQLKSPSICFSKVLKSATLHLILTLCLSASSLHLFTAFSLKSVALTLYPLSASPIACVPIPQEQSRSLMFSGFWWRYLPIKLSIIIDWYFKDSSQFENWRW